MSLRPFVRRRGGRLELRLTQGEADVLRGLLDQMREHLDDGESGDLRRLFPPGYRDDPEAEEEFSRLTRDELREGKREAVLLATATLQRARQRRGFLSVELAEEEEQAWLGVLNDLRLVLGTRMDVTEEAYDRTLDPTDPRAASMQVYLYLGWLEEHLVEELLD